MSRGMSKRHVHEDEEEESVFVSMTDMTVSFLFIVMILLAFFASQFNDEETVPKKELDAVNAAFTALQAQFDALQSELDKLKQENAKLIQENNGLKEALSALQLLLNDVMAENNALKSENASLRADKSDLENANENLRGERDALRQEVLQLRTDLAKLEAEKDELLVEVSRLSELLKNPLEIYVANIDAERRRLLEDLRDAIVTTFPDLTVVVTSEGDVLRFQGEALFKSSEATLLPNARERIQFIADRLNSILPCYTIGSLADFDASCNPAFAIIEAVQIEGHADKSGDYENNMKLSANRAVETHSTMTAHEPRLTLHLNYQSEPILAVAGYGPNRPIDLVNLAPNRRIDLRFIMVTPTKNSEIESIRQRLRQGSIVESPQ